MNTAPQPGETVVLADGTRVDALLFDKVMDGLGVALGQECDRVAFNDLLDMAHGRRLRVPTGPAEIDFMSTYVDSGLCRASVDGTIGMDEQTAIVAQRALKVDTTIDPSEQRNYGFVDPRKYSEGFNNQPSES